MVQLRLLGEAIGGDLGLDVEQLTMQKEAWEP